MKKYLFLMLMLLAASVNAQNSKENNEQLLKDLIEDSFQDIFSNLDPETLPKYYTEDFLLLEDGEVWDMEMIVNYMDTAKAQGQQPERINSFEFVKINIEGNTAWIAYQNKAVFKVGGEVVGEMNWLESATAILKDNHWKLQMLHSTIVPKE